MWVQAIYEKQGRSAQYASEAERDEWVNKELKTLQRALKTKQGNLTELQGQATAATAALTRFQEVGGHNLCKRIRARSTWT